MVKGGRAGPKSRSKKSKIEDRKRHEIFIKQELELVAVRAAAVASFRIGGGYLTLPGWLASKKRSDNRETQPFLNLINFRVN